MTDEELQSLIENWIKESEDTNEYCERSLIVDALRHAEAGNSAEAARRLRQVIPCGKSQFVDRPYFIAELEDNE